MDIVLGVSMEPSAVRMVLIEGVGADGVTVEEDSIEVGASSIGGDEATGASYAPGQVIAGLIGTREGVHEGGHELTSIGVTWTDPGQVVALRAELALHDAGSVMLVSPLLAAAALAQAVGAALEYQHIAMVFVEVSSATLAVVDIADGSIVDLHRQALKGTSIAAELVTMVAGLDSPRSRADGVFLIGCGVDIVKIKPALEAATALVVSVPEEPQIALARGAALASADAPLFASSTSALAYALDPGTGEVNPRALTPSYLDVCAMAGVGEGALAYSAVEESDETAIVARAEPNPESKRKPMATISGALAGIALVAAAMLIVSLASHVRQTAAEHPSRQEAAGTPALQAPATELPAQVLLPVPSSAPAAPPPVEVPAAAPAPPPVVQAPPAVVQAPPQTVTRPAQNPGYLAPAPQPRRAPTRQAAPPVEQAPAAAPAPAPAPVAAPPPAAPVPAQPVPTLYLHLPFVSIPIPLNPPPPPPPPAEPGP